MVIIIINQFVNDSTMIKIQWFINLPVNGLEEKIKLKTTLSRNLLNLARLFCLKGMPNHIYFFIAKLAS